MEESFRRGISLNNIWPSYLVDQGESLFKISYGLTLLALKLRLVYDKGPANSVLPSSVTIS